MIVADTNTIAYLYLNSEKSPQAEKLLALDPAWAAPRLWRSEFRSLLTLYLRKQILTIEEALQINQCAEDLMSENEYDVSASHILQLTNSSTCSAYDCEFVALAKLLNIRLVTADKQILKEFPEVAQTIEQCIA